MNLGEFIDYIESFPKGTKFKHGISEPFSWRGVYDEVAFEFLLHQSMTREEILERIQKALTQTFLGYKGGDFKFFEYTRVNFEAGKSQYSNGCYTMDMLSCIDRKEQYLTNEERLIKKAFKI